MPPAFAGNPQPESEIRPPADGAPISTETLQIEYDPERISYQTLLDIFWKNHDPTRRAWSRQYQSVIFYHNEMQHRLALAAKAGEERRRGKAVRTEILPYTAFHPAEDYHQKYMLRGNKDLLRVFNALFPEDTRWVDSTAAARINGYLGGYGHIGEVAASLDDLGVTAERRQQILGVLESTRD